MKNLIYIFLFFVPLSGFAQQARLQLSDSVIQLGEQTELKVIVDGVHEHDVVRWPSFTVDSNQQAATKLSIVEIVDSSDAAFSNGSLQRTYVLTSFSPGRNLIPSGTVLVNGTAVEMHGTYLLVQNVDVDTTKDIKDIKDIIAVKYIDPKEETASTSWIWWTAGGGLLLLSLVIFLLLRKRKPGTPVVKEPPLPYHLRLLKKLDETAARKLWQHDQTKLYYTEITDVVREFVAIRFGINAFELTSHQMLHQLKVRGVPEMQYIYLRELFTWADLAKFARTKPLADENESALTMARNFILQNAPETPEEKSGDA